MKLLKTLAICFIAFIAVAVTGCNNSFCSDVDKTNIQEKMLENFNNDGKVIDGEKFDGFKGFSDKAKKSWETMLEETKGKTPEEIETAKKEIVIQIYTAEHPKSCLTLNEIKDPITGAVIEGKDWGFAFSKYGGFIEGLLVYPIAALLILLSTAFKVPGVAQVLAIVLGTFIIRFAVVLLTYKQTKAQQRMQLIQPKMMEINAKYEGMNDTNSKNRKAMEMMDLYKKYEINPLTSMLGMFITLPIFISMYGAVQASTTLREGEIFGVSLGQNLSTGILSWNWFAIVLFILMAVSQFLAMKVPTWVAKKKNKHHGNPNQKDPMTGTQNIMTYVMLFMIVFVGWMLPISMTIYWVSSSIFSILQTLLMQNVSSKPKKNKPEEKKSILEQIRG